MKAAFKLLVFLFFNVLVFCSFQNAEEKRNGGLSEKLDSLFAGTPDFSGVALVADHGKVLYHKAFGYRDFETKSVMDVNTIFELASISKQFTSMTIMMLKEEGKLNYDDPIEKYIPGLPYPDVTIRHLLHHTSGLPDYYLVMQKYWDKSKVAGNADNIEYLIRYHPAKLFEPGEKYQYSNTGYMLLASITEKVSGQDFVPFCNERIFKPLKLANTNLRTKDEKLKLKNFAWGHVFVKEKQRYIKADSFPEFNYSIWLGNRNGPGRISSNTVDLLKWDRALYRDKLIKKETLAEAFIPAKLKSDSISNYGFGWMLATHPKLGKVVRHSGGNPGYKTHIIRFIDVDKTVILLCNNEHPDFEAILKKMEELISKT